MKRNAYGRDFGLSTRMFLTMFFLGIVYVAFFVVLVQFVELGILFIGVIMGGLAFVQYFTSDKIALMASGAKVVGPDEAPELHAMVERLAAMADLPKPRVAVIPTEVPNAFATGPEPEALRRRGHAGPLEPPRAAGGRGRARPRAHAHREPRRGRDDDRELLLDARRHAGALRPLGRDVQRRATATGVAARPSG